MRIRRVEAHYLENIPVQPPPLRGVPSSTSALLVEVETSSGIVGWSMAGYAHAIVIDFINRYMGPILVGENALLTDRIRSGLDKHFNRRELGRLLTSALSAVDIALWDIKGKALGQPVHHLLGGARDEVPVYITHGAAYGGDPRYAVEELVAEAEHLVKLGNRHLKNVVGRQAIPDPDDDYLRMRAVREAVGPDVALAMDGNTKMSLSQALRLCKLTEELDIAFLEEPVYDNDPALLKQLRAQTYVPIAAAQNHRFSARALLSSGAVDIIQPNVNNDEGYTGARAISDMADAFNTPIGHGNGSGPHNIAFQAGVRNGTIVEYHFHKWMAYNAIFERVPQPENGYLHASLQPGLDLNPKAGLIDEYEVKP